MAQAATTQGLNKAPELQTKATVEDLTSAMASKKTRKTFLKR